MPPAGSSGRPLKRGQSHASATAAAFLIDLQDDWLAEQGHDWLAASDVRPALRRVGGTGAPVDLWTEPPARRHPQTPSVPPPRLVPDGGGDAGAPGGRTPRPVPAVGADAWTRLPAASARVAPPQARRLAGDHRAGRMSAPDFSPTAWRCGRFCSASCWCSLPPPARMPRRVAWGCARRRHTAPSACRLGRSRHRWRRAPHAADSCGSRVHIEPPCRSSRPGGSPRHRVGPYEPPIGC